MLWPVSDGVQYHLSHTGTVWYEGLHYIWPLQQLLILEIFDDCCLEDVKDLLKRRHEEKEINPKAHKQVAVIQGGKYIPHLLFITLDASHRKQQSNTERTQVAVWCLQTSKYEWSEIFFQKDKSKLAIITNKGATHNLKTFQEFSPEFMVKPQRKNNVKNGRPLHVSQLILW